MSVSATPKGRMLPKLLFSDSQGLSMVMLIPPPRSLSSFGYGNRSLASALLLLRGQRGRVSAGKWSAGCPCSVSLGTGNGAGEMGCCPVLLPENPSGKNPMVMKWGFQNGKGNGEMKGKGHHTSVVFVQ